MAKNAYVLTGTSVPRGLAQLHRPPAVLQRVTHDAESSAALWDRGVMVMERLSLYSGAVDLNDRGQVVGYYTAVDGDRAFLWDRGLLTDLGTLGGDPVEFTVDRLSAGAPPPRVRLTPSSGTTVS